jgi:LCP family protein required for cell wall assembly
MTEDDVRAAFARHEYLTPDAAKVRPAIEAGIARRRVRRRAAWSGGAAFAVVLAMLVPLAAARLGNATVPPPSGASAVEPLNFLLVGHDQRNPGSTGSANAEAIVLAHVDRARQKAYLISIPRDLFITQDQKIGDLHAAGGIARVAQAVTTLTGVPLDGMVAMSFNGLQMVTNAVGGVHMCVDRRVESVHIGVDRDGKFLAPSRGGKPVVYEVGCRTFRGWEALDYLRQRGPSATGNLERDEHVRDYLKALFDKLISAGTLTNPARIGQLLSAAGDAVKVYVADERSPASLASELRGIDAADVASLAVPVERTVQGGSIGYRLAPEAADMFAALREDRLG